MIFSVRFLRNAILLYWVAVLAPGCVSAPATKTLISEPVEEVATPEPEIEPFVESQKLLLGRKELVVVLPQNLLYEARIDTGAAVCSISAVHIERFERDGKKWIRFQLPQPADRDLAEDAEGIKMEVPLVRYTRIRQHGRETQRRPVVKLLVRLGSIEDYIEFSLVDRSGLEFPVLIGRNLLEGYAIVDVSKSHVVSPK